MARSTMGPCAAALVVSALFFNLETSSAWNNGQALTPPMGFANWNFFGCNYDDSTFRNISDVFVASGLTDAGYTYMLVQECIVPAGARDPATGVLQPDPVKFPHGLKDLFDYFHKNGQKAGIYTDVAHLTCAGYEGSGPGPTNPDGHWYLDALTFAQWGVDIIEADFCNTNGVNLTAYELYKGAKDAIAAAYTNVGRPFPVFYQCNWGVESPWLWAPEVSNLFRNTGDICAPGHIAWGNILHNFDNTIVHSSTPPARPGLPGTGIGAWNDADMIGVGMPGITDVEGRSQFSLWCILGNPLFLGTNVLNMSATTLETISNAAAIAINQDPLGVQGYQVDVGQVPVPYNGGTLLNLTSDCSPSVAANLWRLDAATGQISNANSSGDCLAVYDCGNGAGDVIFAYQCVTNQCSNEIFTYDAATGHIVTSVTPAPAQPLCLTAVDPATSPVSQLIVDTCGAGRADQAWTWNADGTLSVTFSAGGPASCLTEFALGGSLYAKPLSPTEGSQALALAVLNRGDQTMEEGFLVDLTLFSFAPSEPVLVYDVWANSTSGPFAGNFTTRPVASHETVLLKVWLA